MTFDYAKSAATALKLITKFGASGTLIKRAEGSYDPATGTATNAETNYSVKAVILPYKREAIASSDLIQQGDMKLLVSPLQTSGAAMIELKPQDKVTVNSEVWVIVNVKPLYPNGTLVFQECQIRK